MTFEKKLQEEINRKREEQWKRCLVYLSYPKSNKTDCTLFNKDYCPLRCSYAQERIKIKPLYVNENIQRKIKRVDELR